MKKELARAFLQATGWRIVGEAPRQSKYVLIAAPHTSNWDFAYLEAITRCLGMRIRWMGKDSLFRGAKGVFFRAMGGISVDRSRPHGMVEQMAEAFGKAKAMILVVPVEGTRNKVEFWKSGFYRIALQAKVPIALGWLDFARKEGGVGPVIEASGDIKADMDKIRAFYANIQGKHPERFAEPRLREESTSPKRS